MKQASRAVHAGRGGKAGTEGHQSGVPLAPDLSPAAVHVYTDLDEYDAVATPASAPSSSATACSSIVRLLFELRP